MHVTLEHMNRPLRLILNSAVTAFLLIGPGNALAADLDYLFERLKTPELAEWRDIESQIERELALSGSASMDLLLQRGRAAMSGGKPGEAVEHFSALIDHAPDFAEAWNGRAAAFFALDYFGMALADLEHVLALEPRHYDAWQGVGVILNELGRPDLALRAFRAAAAIHPHDPDLLGLLNRLEVEQGGVSL